MRLNRLFEMAGLTVAIAASGLPCEAAEFQYVDWTQADVGRGTASGVIRLSDGSTVTVTFEAITAEGGPGQLWGAQVDGAGINYWLPEDPYVSAEVENPPPTTDIIQLAGGLDHTYLVTLSEPIKDPVMAIVSLGAPGIPTTYDFDAPFTIVSQGPGYWGGSDTALSELDDNVLRGEEGHGTIRFIGAFSTFSWTVPTPEGWHGFTFAIRTTERLEPTDAGFTSPDGGSAPTDTGIDPIDAGVVRDDVGLAPVDAGRAADAGEPAAPVDEDEPSCDCRASSTRKPNGSVPFASLMTIAVLLMQRRRQRGAARRYAGRAPTNRRCARAGSTS